MRRIAFAIGLSGLLAACGQQAQPAGEGGAPGQPLDYIDAVPITEDAPVARPEPTAKKGEAEEEETTPAEAEKSDAAPAATAPAPAATPRPAAPSADAATATRRANEAVAPRSATEAPYSPN